MIGKNEYYNEMESEVTDLLAGYPVKSISHIGSPQDIRRQILTNNIIIIGNDSFIGEWDWIRMR